MKSLIVSILFFIGSPSLGKPKSALVINFGTSPLDNYASFNKEIEVVSSKYKSEQVQILNGAGRGSHVNTGKVNSFGRPIYGYGISSPKADLSNAQKSLAIELGKADTDSFIYITGHGDRGNTPTWEDRKTIGEEFKYRELVSKIVNRQDKSKKVKLLISNCMSGSVFSEFKKTGDFDGNFCAGTTGTADQLTVGANIEQVKAATTLNEYLSASQKTGVSTPMRTSIRFAELALKESLLNDDGKFSCLLHSKVNLKEQEADIRSLIDDLSIVWDLPRGRLNNEVYVSRRQCNIDVYAAKFPIKLKRYNELLAKLQKDPKNLELKYDYERFIEEAESFPSLDSDSLPVIECVLDKLSEPYKSQFKRTLEDKAQYFEQRDIKSNKIKLGPSLQFEARDLIDDVSDEEVLRVAKEMRERRQALLSKYKSDPKLLHESLALIEYQSSREAQRLNQYLKIVEKDFEALLKTSFGEQYRATYEALKKCESEKVN